jgi:hypothetical protein
MCEMNTKSNPPSHRHPHRDVDARVGDALIEVKFGVDALRTLRTSLRRGGGAPSWSVQIAMRKSVGTFQRRKAL